MTENFVSQKSTVTRLFLSSCIVLNRLTKASKVLFFLILHILHLFKLQFHFLFSQGKRLSRSKFISACFFKACQIIQMHAQMSHWKRSDWLSYRWEGPKCDRHYQKQKEWYFDLISFRLRCRPEEESIRLAFFKAFSLFSIYIY